MVAIVDDSDPPFAECDDMWRRSGQLHVVYLWSAVSSRASSADATASNSTRAAVRSRSRRPAPLLEVTRLDALQVALWDKALAGDVEAGQAIILIIRARCRLLGLCQESKRPGAWAPRTVVLSAEDREVLGLPHVAPPLGISAGKTDSAATRPV